jgi:hypothetical protein
MAAAKRFENESTKKIVFSTNFEYTNLLLKFGIQEGPILYVMNISNPFIKDYPLTIFDNTVIPANTAFDSVSVFRDKRDVTFTNASVGVTWYMVTKTHLYGVIYRGPLQANTSRAQASFAPPIEHGFGEGDDEAIIGFEAYDKVVLLYSKKVLKVYQMAIPSPGVAVFLLKNEQDASVQLKNIDQIAVVKTNGFRLYKQKGKGKFSVFQTLPSIEWSPFVEGVGRKKMLGEQDFETIQFLNSGYGNVVIKAYNGIMYKYFVVRSSKQVEQRPQGLRLQGSLQPHAPQLLEGLRKRQVPVPLRVHSRREILEEAGASHPQAVHIPIPSRRDSTAGQHNNNRQLPFVHERIRLQHKPGRPAERAVEDRGRLAFLHHRPHVSRSHQRKVLADDKSAGFPDEQRTKDGQLHHHGGHALRSTHSRDQVPDERRFHLLVRKDRELLLDFDVVHRDWSCTCCSFQNLQVVD